MLLDKIIGQKFIILWRRKSVIEIKKMMKKCADQLGNVYIKNDVKMYEKQNWN